MLQIIIFKLRVIFKNTAQAEVQASGACTRCREQAHALIHIRVAIGFLFL